MKLLAMAKDEGATRAERLDRAYEARAKLAGRTDRAARRKRVVEAIGAEKIQKKGWVRESASPMGGIRSRQGKEVVALRRGSPTEFCGWCDTVTTVAGLRLQGRNISLSGRLIIVTQHA